MITGEQIVKEAETWLNTPFHHRAMIKGVGVDCAHLLIGVFSALGAFQEFRPTDYPNDWHLHRSDERFLGYMAAYATEVDEPKVGDVALFRFGRCVSHGSIVIEWPMVIHAYIGQGVVRANAIESPKLRGRLACFWRMRGTE